MSLATITLVDLRFSVDLIRPLRCIILVVRGIFVAIVFILRLRGLPDNVHRVDPSAALFERVGVEGEVAVEHVLFRSESVALILLDDGPAGHELEVKSCVCEGVDDGLGANLFTLISRLQNIIEEKGTIP